MAGGRHTVLIVEDHQITRTGLRLTIEQDSQFEVVGEAASGKSAVAQAKELKPELVLMDIGLPEMNGIEAAKLIKSALPATRLVMLTSHDSDEDIFSALAAGADAYCLKDIASEQLMIALKTVADGGGWLDPAIAGRVLRSSASRVLPPANESKFMLSDREFEVLRLLVEGLSNLQMAERLKVSPETIKTHMRHIMEKLAVSDRTQAAVKALRAGLV